MAVSSLATRRSGAAVRPSTRSATVMSRRALVIRNFQEDDKSASTKVKERYPNTPNKLPGDPQHNNSDRNPAAEERRRSGHKGEAGAPQQTPQRDSDSKRSSTSNSSSNDNKMPTQPAADNPEQTNWLPGAEPIVEFLAAENIKPQGFTDQDKNPYDPKVHPSNEEAFGWNKLPELINGRAAMIGFVAYANAEVLGRGSFWQQLYAAPAGVVTTIAIIALATIVPAVRTTKESDLRSLRRQFNIPENLFTNKNEKFHGRVAMLALVTLALIEMYTHRPFFGF